MSLLCAPCLFVKKGTGLKIDLFLSRSEIQLDKIADRVAIVIDVWRASTSIITALANGCKGIIPVAEVEQAKELAKKFLPNAILLGGERNEMPIPGFDLSNSPLDYTTERVKNKRIIFTSTNGSQLFNLARSAEMVTVGGFLNVSLLSNFILTRQQDITILCAGKNGGFGLEDAVCGGMIIEKIFQKKPQILESNDGAIAAHALFNYFADNLASMIDQSSHGRRLKEIGQEHDLLLALEVDSRNIIPILKNNELICYNVVDS